MLSLDSIRDYIASLGVTANDSVYIGKLDNKKQHSIGVYHRKGSGAPVMALGGRGCSSYDICRISLLVHWDKNPVQSEQAAYGLYEKLGNVSSLSIGDTHIHYLRLMVPEPQDVGTDDSGVYESVIWLDFIYQRE